MKCWYIYGEDCERHGICEGCQKYEDWRKESERMAGLKPCPFCGSDAVFKSRNTTKDLNPRVECTKCTCIVLGVSEDDAIESWNRRV